MSAMPEFHYSVADEVFEKFPGYVRGVVVSHGVANGASPPELVQLLRDAEESVRTRVDPEHVTEEPRINAWREAYRAFGAKPSEFRSSIEAMVRRVLRGDELPSINALVDIGNVVSLRYLVPAGGHAIDHLTENLELRFATGLETFVPFGSADTDSDTEVEHPLPGEAVFVEGDVVLTRRWVWRQASATMTLPETRAIEFNVDGLPPVTPAEVEAACGEIAELVGRFCGGTSRVTTLSAANPRMSLAAAEL